MAGSHGGAPPKVPCSLDQCFACVRVAYVRVCVFGFVGVVSFLVQGRRERLLEWDDDVLGQVCVLSLSLSPSQCL